MRCSLQFLPGCSGLESIPDSLRSSSATTLASPSRTASPRSRSTVSNLSMSSGQTAARHPRGRRIPGGIARKRAYHVGQGSERVSGLTSSNTPELHFVPLPGRYCVTKVTGTPAAPASLAAPDAETPKVLLPNRGLGSPPAMKRKRPGSFMIYRFETPECGLPEVSRGLAAGVRSCPMYYPGRRAVHGPADALQGRCNAADAVRRLLPGAGGARIGRVRLL